MIRFDFDSILTTYNSYGNLETESICDYYVTVNPWQDSVL